MTKYNQKTTAWTTTHSTWKELSRWRFDAEYVICEIFLTYCGPNQHLRSCSNKPRDPDIDILANQPCSSGTNVTNERENSVDVVRQLTCGERNGEEVAQVKAEVYEKVLFWKRNLFRLPTGVVQKSCTTKVTKLMNGCVNNSPFKNIAFKATRVMPRLLLPTKQNMSWPKEKWRDRRIYFIRLRQYKTI